VSLNYFFLWATVCASIICTVEQKTKQKRIIQLKWPNFPTRNYQRVKHQFSHKKLSELNKQNKWIKNIYTLLRWQIYFQARPWPKACAQPNILQGLAVYCSTTGKEHNVSQATLPVNYIYSNQRSMQIHEYLTFRFGPAEEMHTQVTVKLV